MATLVHQRSRRAVVVHGALAAVALAMALGLPPSRAGAQPESAPRFVMGTVDRENSYLAKWYRRIYGEAFRRLGMRVELTTYPTQRIGVLLDQGGVDGEAVRARVYAAAHPDAIRVEESVFDATFGLYTANPALELKRLEDLPATKLRVIYRRGVLLCEKALASVLAPVHTSDVTQVDQGLLMLLTGRADLFCDLDASVLNALDAEGVKGAGTIRSVLELGSVPLYAYLHQKHAALAPRLAAVLKAMKAEGLIERYRTEALREAGR